MSSSLGRRQGQWIFSLLDFFLLIFNNQYFPFNSFLVPYCILFELISLLSKFDSIFDVNDIFTVTLLSVDILRTFQEDID